MNKFYLNVSDIALCQRCPALFAYKFHKKEKKAHFIGIKGCGDAYGSIFHKNIAEKFFRAASDPKNILHEELLSAVSNGDEALEKFIREKIFMPFVADNSENLKSGQIMAMAGGINVWVRAMNEFFRSIQSFNNHKGKIFIEPEKTLCAACDFGEDRLIITGRYDALMFNPDKIEARLFEFKGFKKSDITVSLTQSLIYAWLISKYSGIVPSVEVIYLDENEKSPDIFDSQSVKGMINSSLLDLFQMVLNIISLRRFPEILKDRNLCCKCDFKTTCKDDMNGIFKFKKRRGGSLINVLVFFVAAVLITAQVFFFSVNSSESTFEDTYLTNTRLNLAAQVEKAKEVIRDDEDKVNAPSNQKITYANFYDNTRKDKKSFYEEDNITVNIHDLNFTFDNDNGSGLKNSWKDQTGEGKMHMKIFPAMGKNHYLIRAYTKLKSGSYLMYQVLVEKNGTSAPKTLSYEEIWY